MSEYRLTRQARADLEEIVDYVLAESGPDRAVAVAERIFRAIEGLMETPGKGHVREDLTDEDVRFWTVLSYHLVYRAESRPLEVVAVISGWRDVGAELKRRTP